MTSTDHLAAAWNAFCDDLAAELKSAGAAILDQVTSDLDSAEGLRMLLRALRQSLLGTIDASDTDFPIFTLAYDDTVQVVASNPDYCVFMAAVRGGVGYRIRGVLGQADMITFTSDTMGPHDPADERLMTASLTRADLDIGPDGSFEVTVSPTAPNAGTWLAAGPVTDTIVVRNTFSGPWRQHRRRSPVALEIARLDGPTVPSPYTSQRLSRGLTATIENVASPLRRNRLLRRCRERGNGVFANEALDLGRGFDPRRFTQTAYWRLEPGEAMVIDATTPETFSFWSLVCTNWWLETLDHRYSSTYLNPSLATIAEGRLRVVLADRDPEVANWIDTTGHREGALVWRWLDATGLPPAPRTVVVPVSALRSRPGRNHLMQGR